MLCSLLFWDSQGNVVGTLNYLIARDGDDGPAVGLYDFDAFEQAGGKFRTLCGVSNATGGGTWPEWLGGQAHDFRIELDGPPSKKRIHALVHKKSGQRRERADLEAKIAARVAEAGGKPADIRDLVGGPSNPLLLDEDGRTKPHPDKESIPVWVVKPKAPLPKRTERDR